MRDAVVPTDNLLASCLVVCPIGGMDGAGASFQVRNRGGEVLELHKRKSTQIN